MTRTPGAAALRLLLIAAVLVGAPATVRAAGCADAAGKVEAQLKKLQQDEKKHRAETGKAALPTEGFYGTPASLGRSLDLARNAKELAKHGKEASCRDVVQEARRAAGLKDEGAQ